MRLTRVVSFFTRPLFPLYTFYWSFTPFFTYEPGSHSCMNF